MIYHVWHFCRYLPTYFKFFITNWRFNIYGYRRYKVILSETISKEKGGGYHHSKPLFITARSETILHPDGLIEKNADPKRVAFFKVRDEHTEMFIKHDIFDCKEII